MKSENSLSVSPSSTQMTGPISGKLLVHINHIIKIVLSNCISFTATWASNDVSYMDNSSASTSLCLPNSNTTISSTPTAFGKKNSDFHNGFHKLELLTSTNIHNKTNGCRPSSNLLVEDLSISTSDSA